MGETGTEVAKQSSDMILVDNSFVNISNAVFEGRRIFDNIEKFINYLLATNLAEVLIILVAVFFAFPFPLIPIQILWINLITDGLPAIALGMDPASKDIMKKKPYKEKKIFSKEMLFAILLIGIIVTFGVLLIYFSNISKVSLEIARTMALTTLVLLEIVILDAVRNRFGQGLFSNPTLLLSLAGAFGAHFLILYTPLSRFFHTVPLTLGQWGSILLVVIPLILGFRLLSFILRFIREKHSERT
jgi:Ca2+-transporting ATPase